LTKIINGLSLDQQVNLHAAHNRVACPRDLKADVSLPSWT